ncbi:uncharacterized protein [Typha latifolia]|uniref:uncharacterized protein n=1 Tax=Typha latifolia TaxID=4733 RepID=UPI003C2D6A96
MVVRFGRSLTFPTPKLTPLRPSSCHVRSKSLSDRFHLDDSISALNFWSTSSGSPSATWISDGLAHLALLLSCLSDLLLLLSSPQTADPMRRLRRRSTWIDDLLDDLLILADLHGSFRTSLVGLHHHQSETRAAVRRRDHARLSSAVRSQRRVDREISRLAAAAREVLCRSRAAPSATSSVCDEEAAIADSVKEATAAAASASAAVFAGIATVSTATLAGPGRVSFPPAGDAGSGKAGSPARVWWVVNLLRWRRRAKKRSGKKGREADEGAVEEEKEKKRKAALERLEKLEECIRAAETGNEKVFRALVNTRVSLLNILTPSF